MKINDIHQQIADEAAYIRRLAGPQKMISHKAMPALNDLFDSAAAALSLSIPARFEHLGKIYFLRVSIGVSRMEIFNDPASLEPMVTAIHGDVECFGHQPPSDERQEKNNSKD